MPSATAFEKQVVSLAQANLHCVAKDVLKLRPILQSQPLSFAGITRVTITSFQYFFFCKEKGIITLKKKDVHICKCTHACRCLCRLEQGAGSPGAGVNSQL